MPSQNSDKPKCDCAEMIFGGLSCTSNDCCEYQVFGTFDEPIMCGKPEGIP